eukprot:5520-Heterococcus_DN1.PRE.3
MQILLQNGADVLVATTMGITALHTAAAVGCTATCDVLLARESSLVHMKDINECTALMRAAAYGFVDTVVVLLHYGADINTVNDSNATPLMAACMHKQIGMTALLIRAGADVNAVDCEGNCALMAAVKANSIDLVHLLLNNDADIHCADSNGENALCKAAYYGHVSVMEVLVQRGLSSTSVDSYGRTLLMLAAKDGQKHAMEWILQHGCDVNAVDHEGFTALHSVSSFSSDDTTLIELLLAYGADVTKHAVKFITALDTAALFGKSECARALIAAGVDVNIPDRHLSSNTLM